MFLGTQYCCNFIYMKKTGNRIRRIFIREFRDILILVLISTAATYLFAGNHLINNFFAYTKSIFYGFVVGWTIWKGNQLLGYFLDELMPWDRNPGTTLFYHLAASVIFTAIDIVIVNFLIYKYVFHANILNDLRHFFYYSLLQFGIAMLITTIFYVRQFFIFWRESVIQKEKFKQEVLTMQYETLKSYVNPHFLFNCLSILSSLVEKDTVKSQEFIMQLSDIYRYILEQKDKELVSLDSELKFTNSYINLHRIRHGENLKVDLEVDDTSGHIVPLSIQILLENAFKHNIISQDEPLFVTIRREKDYIIVQNNLQIRKTINQGRGIGLETISKRYEFYTQRSLRIDSSNGLFTVMLPVLDLSTLEGYR